MNLTDREATIQQIAAEFELASTEVFQQKVLREWRAKLGTEPFSLPSFRIDIIVREVRKRLIAVSPQSNCSIHGLQVEPGPASPEIPTVPLQPSIGAICPSCLS
jgi:hypothetical protein